METCKKKAKNLVKEEDVEDDRRKRDDRRMYDLSNPKIEPKKVKSEMYWRDPLRDSLSFPLPFL